MARAKKDYPSAQPFNVSPRRNQTKKNSWWAHPPYHNNTTKTKGAVSEVK